LESPDDDTLVRWQRISAGLNAHHINTPLLINAADSEYIADMQLVNSLRDWRKPIEMFIYPGEHHVKNQPKHRYEIYERNVDWFNFWLQGHEISDPEKTEQYRRWEELCDMQLVANPLRPTLCVGTKH
jgi:dipeptidyl aminopeptidase/acylaminoacyl peptidase